MSFTLEWGKLLLATGGPGASKNSEHSDSSGSLSLLDEVGEPTLEPALSVCATYDHVFEAELIEENPSANEEHPGELKESRLSPEEAEQL